MGFQKLIVAFDGSEGSMKALRHGLAYAKENDAHLTVVHVVKKRKEEAGFMTASQTGIASGDMYQNMNPASQGILTTDAQDANVHEDQLHAEAAEVLKGAKHVLKTEGVRAETEVLEGDVADEIDHYATANETDLIVVGHRGLGGLKKFVLGSVSEKIVGKASCSVLVVK